jgi:hypothetical protein
MDLTLGPEQEAVRDAIRGVSPILPGTRPAGDDRSPRSTRRWRGATSLGWFGLALPRMRTARVRPGRAALLFQEIGRGVIPGPGSARCSRGVPWPRRPARTTACAVLAGAVRLAVVDDPATAWCAARDSGEAHTVLDRGGARLPVLGREVPLIAADAPDVGCAPRPAWTRRDGSAA